MGSGQQADDLVPDPKKILNCILKLAGGQLLTEVNKRLLNNCYMQNTLLGTVEYKKMSERSTKIIILRSHGDRPVDGDLLDWP